MEDLGTLRKLSNLEQTVLGLVWLRGPCTVYAVMRELSLSESSFHKSRAGTAYSIAKRLIASGLLATLPSKQVEITALGMTILQDWLSEPVPLEDVAHSADLIRLRFFFLGAVSLETRLHFIDSSLASLDDFLKRCEALLWENESIGDYFGVLATASTLYETRARMQWLRLVRRWVEAPMEPGASWSKTVMDHYLIG